MGFASWRKALNRIFKYNRRVRVPDTFRPTFDTLEDRVTPAAITNVVASQPLVSLATPVNTEDQSVLPGQVLATFDDAGGLAVLNDLTATIIWGDGSTDIVTATSLSVANIVSTGVTSFQVVALPTGAHVYEEAAASSQITITIDDTGATVAPQDSEGDSTDLNNGNGIADLNVIVHGVSGPGLQPIGEGTATPNQQVIGTFTDPGNSSGIFDLDQSPAKPEYSVTIDWGDNSVPDIVSSNFNPGSFSYLGGGKFSVAAPAHTYDEEGDYSISMTVTHDGLPAIGPVITDFITVNDQPVAVLTNSGPALTIIDEGTATNLGQEVGTFSDPGNPNGVFDNTQTAQAPEYTVTIDWGDQSAPDTINSFTDIGSFTYIGNGQFTVSAPAHTYAEEGNYNITLTVTHNAFTAGPTQTDAITVNDPAVVVITNSGSVLTNIIEGQSTPDGVLIGSFVDQGDLNGDLTGQTANNPEYTVVIDWGDGQTDTVDSFNNPTNVVATGNGSGLVDVFAPAHTYAEEGNFNITLTVTHNALPAVGPTQTANITVDDPTVSIDSNSGGPLGNINEEQSTFANANVGTFNDPGNLNGTIDAGQTVNNPEYTVVIDWADGSFDTLDSFNNPGAFIPIGNGTFAVLAPAHFYAEEGTYNINLTVTHNTQAPVGPVQTDSITVADAPVTINPNSGDPLTNINEEASTPANVLIGTFTDPGDQGGLLTGQSAANPEYTVVVDWGDGTSDTFDSFNDPANVVATGLAGGRVNVFAPAHQYLEDGNFSITLTVTHNGLPPVGPIQTDTITVDDLPVSINANSGDALADVPEGGTTTAGAVIGTFNDPGNTAGTFTGQTAGNPEYVAVIDWGDGTSTTIDSFNDTADFVSVGGGLFNVVPAAHTYAAEEGAYNITLSVTHDALPLVGPVQTDLINVSGETQITVDFVQPLANINEAGATPAGAVVGAITDPGNAAGTFDAGQTTLTPEYSVVIDWGDGSTDSLDSFNNPNSFVPDGSGTFFVHAPAHTYAEEGTYPISMTATHNALPPVGPVQTSSIVVDDPNVSINPNSGDPLANINEGSSTPAGFLVGSFTDSGDPTGLLTGQTALNPEYTVTINWGDGTSDTFDSFNNPAEVDVTGNGGLVNVFTPVGHTYAEEGTHSITLTVTHNALAAAGPVQTDSITVNDIPVAIDTNSGVALANINEGQSTPDGVLIGTFTDPGDPQGLLTGQTALNPEYTVVIDWGDGTSSTVDSFTNPTNVVATGIGGVVEVHAPAHLYAEEGSYNITLTVTHQALGAVGPVQTDSITVDEVPVSVDPDSGAALGNINENDSTPAGTLIGTFTDLGNPTGTLTGQTANNPEYIVVVDWGDNTTSTFDSFHNPTVVVPTGVGGVVNVVAPAHQYLEEGTYAITLTVTHNALPAVGPTQTDTITVNDVPVAINPDSGDPLANINEEGSTPAGALIGTFTDPGDPAGALTGQTALDPEYIVVVNWGDGTSDTFDSFSNPLNIVPTGVGGVVNVFTPAHQYAEEGTFSITLTVTHNGLPNVGPVQTDTITVDEPAVTITAGAGTLATVNEGIATADGLVVGTFTDSGNTAGTFDAGQTAQNPEYKVVIDWGDNTTDTLDSFTNPGAFNPTGGGNFDVLAPAHTYADEGIFNVSLTVTHNGLADVGPTQTGSVTVNEADLAVNVNAIKARVGVAFNGAVATFTDRDDVGLGNGSFTATIDWGDGSAVDPNATITNDGNGNFTVSGSHTYSTPPNTATPYTLKVTVTQTGAQGGTTAATNTATVGPVIIYDANAKTLTVSDFNRFSFSQVSTQDINGVIHTTYTFDIDDIIRTFTDAQLVSANLTGEVGTFNTSNILTNDTYLGNDLNTHETAERLTVGNHGAEVDKLDPNGIPTTFITVSGVSGSYGVGGQADQGFITCSPGVHNVFVGAGSYSYSYIQERPNEFYFLRGTQYVYSTALSAMDFAYQYDGTGQSFYVVSGTTYSYMTGTDSGKHYFNEGVGFNFNEGIATHAGETATFYDSALNDTFNGFQFFSSMTNNNGELDQAAFFAQVFAFSFVGGTDTANNFAPTVVHVVGFK